MTIITTANIEKRHNSKDLSYLWQSLDKKVNNASEECNNLNDNILSLLVDGTTLLEDLTKELSIVLNNLSTFSVISGNSISSFNPTALPVISNNNIIFDSQTGSMMVADKNIQKPIFENILLSGSCTVGDTSTSGRIRNNNLGSLPFGGRVDFESYNSELAAMLDIHFSNLSPVNGLTFTFGNNGVRYPKISSIIGVNNNGERFIIASDIDTEISNGVLNLRFPLIQISHINIEFSQIYSEKLNGRDRYSASISNFSTGLFSSEDGGEIVFGPYISEYEIFKVSIDQEIAKYKNISVYISNNNNDWYQISSSLKNDNIAKIINFNNISEDSIKTSSKVKKIFVKFVFSSEAKQFIKSNSDIFSAEIIGYDNFTRLINIDQSKELTSIYETNGEFIGGKGGIDSVDFNKIDLISVDGEFFCKGSNINIVNCIGYSNYAYPFVKYTESYEVDIGKHIIGETSNIYTFSNPRPVDINITSTISNDTTKYVIKVKDGITFGMFEITIGDKIFNLDLSTGFSINSASAIFCGNDNICKVIDPNNNIYEINPFYTNEDGESYFSLMGVIFEDIESDYYSKTFPVNKLGINQWVIINGNIVAGRNLRDYTKVNIIKLNRCDFSVRESVNGNLLYVDSGKRTRVKYQLEGYDFEKVVKLKHCNIINNSIKFDFSMASINNLIYEVDYIDGKSEFISKTRERVSSNRNKNRIKISPHFIDNNTLKVIGGSTSIVNRVYSNMELIEYGDYFIYKSTENDIGHPYYEIRLPDGVFTQNTIDTVIEYDINNINKSNAGVYSVDYKNGVLYTSAPIDASTYIEYQYSNIVASGTSGRLLMEDEYKETRSTVVITGNIESQNVALIYKNGNDEKIEYIQSDKIDRITINILDEKSL